MIISFILLLILLGGSLFVNYNLYSNLDRFEQNYIDLEASKGQDEEFILSLRQRALQFSSQLRQLDRLGAFESDDEVGHFFSDLKQMVTDISAYFDIRDEEIEEELRRLQSIQQ